MRVNKAKYWGESRIWRSVLAARDLGLVSILGSRNAVWVNVFPTLHGWRRFAFVKYRNYARLYACRDGTVRAAGAKNARTAAKSSVRVLECCSEIRSNCIRNEWIEDSNERSYISPTLRTSLLKTLSAPLAEPCL